MSVYLPIYNEIQKDLIPIFQAIHVTCKLYSNKTMMPYVLLFLYQYLPTIANNPEFTSIYIIIIYLFI